MTARRGLCLLLILVFLAAPSLLAGGDEIQVLVMAPGFQKDWALGKDRDSIAANFDFILEPRNWDQTLSELAKVGRGGRIRRAVFLGHGYQVDGKGGIIDFGQDVNAAALRTYRIRAYNRGDSSVLDAFAGDAEVIYYNCHAGQDPEFLKESANLFLAFSGGTMYGSDDYVSSDVSAVNRVLYCLSWLPFVEVNFKSPSKVDYRKFPQATLPTFLWRETAKMPCSVKGQKEVKPLTRVFLEAVLPEEYARAGLEPHIRCWWIEEFAPGRRSRIGQGPRLAVEMGKTGKRNLTLEVRLDNEVGARLLASVPHSIEVKDEEPRTPSPTPTPTSTPEAPVLKPTILAPSEVLQTDEFELTVKLPAGMSAGRFEWVQKGYQGGQSVETTIATTSEPSLKHQIGWNEPRSFLVKVYDAGGKYLATSESIGVKPLAPHFSLTLYGEGWQGEERESGALAYRRPASLTVDEKLDSGNGSAHATGSAGEATFSVRWMDSQELGDGVEGNIVVAGFRGNGKRFVKGKYGFIVDSQAQAYFWTNTGGPDGGKLADSLRSKHQPFIDARRKATQRDLDSMLASLTIKGVHEERKAPGHPDEPVPVTPDTTPTPGTTPSPPEPPDKTPPDKTPPDTGVTTPTTKPTSAGTAAAEALEKRIRALVAQGKHEDALGLLEAAGSRPASLTDWLVFECKKLAWELLGLSPLPEFDRSIRLLEGCVRLAPSDKDAVAKLAQARQARQSYQRMLELLKTFRAQLAAKKTFTAYETLKAMYDSQQGMRGSPKLLEQASQEYNEANLAMNAFVTEHQTAWSGCFKSRNWAEGVRVLEEALGSWELSPATDKDFRSSLAMARTNLAEQKAATQTYRHVRAAWEGGKLAEPYKHAGKVRPDLMVEGDPEAPDMQALMTALQKNMQPAWPVGKAERRPTLLAAYGRQVDTRTVRVFLDDQDVTAASEVSSYGIRYVPLQDLSGGSHQARITADGQFERGWTFTVAGGSAAQSSLNVGNKLMADGKPAEAEAAFTQAVTTDPNNGRAYERRGDARRAQGNLPGAIADYDQAIALDPGNSGALVKRGNTKNRYLDPTGAEADFTQAIALKPDEASAYLGRGNARMQLGNPAGAASDYDEVIRLTPDSAPGYQNRGAAREELGDFKGALADYEHAIKLDPKLKAASERRNRLVKAHPELVGGASATTTRPPSTPKNPPSTPKNPPAGRITRGSVTSESRYDPNCQGNVFTGGTWCNAKNGSDWLQFTFDGTYRVTAVRIIEAGTDVTTNNSSMEMLLLAPDGRWVRLDRLENTNINKVHLSGGGRGNSVPDYSLSLSQPVEARAFRLALTGNGWFGARDIAIYGTAVNATVKTNPPPPPAGATEVVAILENRSGQNVHIFAQGDNFGPHNRLTPGQKSEVRVTLPADGRIRFTCGRDGRVLGTVRWDGDPSDPSRYPRVTFTPQEKLVVTTGLR